jgi:hypothetical protein
MQTRPEIRFEAILKQIDTRRAQIGYKATDRELALISTFWEQIAPTYAEYGKLRKRIDEMEARLPKRPCNERYREQPQ